MTPQEQYVQKILGPLHRAPAQNRIASAFMPSNIALVKYWGKRDGALNLPLVSSLSYTLDNYGTTTELSLADADSVELNGQPLAPVDADFLKLHAFLNLFRAEGERYRVATRNNIPTAAGVASSASGFAALLETLVKLKGWNIAAKEKSMLARLGSGSAARSFWPGVVLWHKGARDDGMDCFAEPTAIKEKFHMTVLLFDKEKKQISSRRAMELSLKTSPLAQGWPAKQQQHLDAVLSAPDFQTLGEAVEENAVLLHDLLARSSPPIVFDKLETTTWKQKIRDWRKHGVPVYFTQDAGPNLKLIFPFEFKDVVEGELKNRSIDYFTV
jgi:diphosphomevalonate decarboxylase